MKYTTRGDAATELWNSGYPGWYLTPGEDGYESGPMTDDQAQEIISIMWMRDLCSGCAVREWLIENDEPFHLYDSLPHAGHCEEEEEE